MDTRQMTIEDLDPTMEESMEDYFGSDAGYGMESPEALAKIYDDAYEFTEEYTYFASYMVEFTLYRDGEPVATETTMDNGFFTLPDLITADNCVDLLEELEFFLETEQYENRNLGDDVSVTCKVFNYQMVDL